MRAQVPILHLKEVIQPRTDRHLILRRNQGKHTAAQDCNIYIWHFENRAAEHSEFSQYAVTPNFFLKTARCGEYGRSV